ncbi:MAG TPA: O-antigen ligase family protein, partial [Chloroflexota bacterium]|nr:O-antigen ligase family protein [Chloroflexota bacterium]
MRVAPRGSVRQASRWSPIAGAFLLVGAAAYAFGSTPVAFLGLLLIFVGAIGAPHQALALAVLVVPAYLHGRELLGYQFSPHTIAIGLTGLAIVVRFAWAVVRRWRGTNVGQWRARLVPRPVDVAVVAIVLLGIASMAITIRPTETMRALREVILVPILFYYLALLTFTGRVPALAPDLPPEGEVAARVGDPPRDHVPPTSAVASRSPHLEWLAAALVIAGLASALIGLAQLVIGSNLIEAEGTVRIRALYGSPNNLGLLLGRAIPLAVALALAGQYLRWPYLIALGPMLLALLLTYSVGAWFGVGVALVAVALLARRRGPWLLVGALGIAGLLAIPVLHVERVVSHFSLTSSTTFFRLKIWESSLMMLRDFPITGIGLNAFQGHYDPALDGQYMRPEAWQESTISHPHNLILDVWLSLGLPGLIAGTVIAIAFVRFARCILVRQAGADDSERASLARPMAIGAVGAMMDLAVHGAIDNSYFLPDLAVLFWSTFVIVRVLALSPQGIGSIHQLNLADSRSPTRSPDAPIPVPTFRPPRKRRQVSVKVMVTGGAGFIGSHLCARLLADGHQVTCVDNLITGNTDNIAML